MNDCYRFDDQKLMFHPKRVHGWLDGKDIFPIYMEISPSGACNHRCIFCAFDYLGYKSQFIVKDRLKKILKELAEYGVKSINYSGEGEPFLHPDMPEIILFTKRIGIDVAVAINGVLFSSEVAKKCLSALTWIKVSINAGTRETYKKIHRCAERDFDRVLENLADAVKIKSQNDCATTIGAQMLLLPENIDEIPVLARTLKNIGVDYLVIKPYVRHPMSKNVAGDNFSREKLLQIASENKCTNSDNFKLIFRIDALNKLLTEKRRYGKCFGLPFFAEILSNGDVYSCGPYLGNPNFCYGNIYHDTFGEIWRGGRRKRILQFVHDELDVNTCMKNCRLDEINAFLWELKNPPPHVNFI